MNYLKKSYDTRKSPILINKSNYSFNINDLKISISLNKKNYDNLKKKMKKDNSQKLGNKSLTKRNESSNEKNIDNQNFSLKEEKNKKLIRSIFHLNNNDQEQESNDLNILKSNSNNKKNFYNFLKTKTNKKVRKYQNSVSLYRTENKNMFLSNNFITNSIKDTLVKNIKFREKNELFKNKLNNYFRYIHKSKLAKKIKFSKGQLNDENYINNNYRYIQHTYGHKMNPINTTTIIRSIYSNPDKKIFSFIKNRKIKTFNEIKNSIYKKRRKENIIYGYEQQFSYRHKKAENPFDSSTIDLAINYSSNKNLLEDKFISINQNKSSKISAKINYKNNNRPILNKNSFIKELNRFKKKLNEENSLRTYNTIENERINSTLEKSCKDLIYKNNSDNFKNIIYNNYNSNIENNNNQKSNNLIYSINNKKLKLLHASQAIKIKNKNNNIKKQKIIKNKKILSLSTHDLFNNHCKLIRKSTSHINHLNKEIKNSISGKREIITKKIAVNASVTKKSNNYLGEKKNQDTLFKVKFTDINFSFYGVCDGHGKNGHLISEYIKNNLPIIFYNKLKKIITSNLKKEKNKININYKKLFRESFSIIESNIINNININIDFSGSTCTSLLFTQYSIISANIGDCRAIKGQLINNKWSYELLTRDHKPKEKDEAERIIKLNGEIHPVKNNDGTYSGPKRVWIKEKNYPGLTITRVIGDKLFKKVGVSSEPEIRIIPYKKWDKFVIIASDGLWEYVLNKEVVKIVSYYYMINDCDNAVIKLYEVAYNRWINNRRYIDDISIIVVFLE